MNISNNVTKKDKRTETLWEPELELLEKLSKSASSFSEFAINVKVERTALMNTIARGSASPSTVRKIRKYLQLQTA